MEIAVDFMVIPRSFSSSRVSVNRISPALDEAMIPAFETRESVRVDFPWSTEHEKYATSQWKSQGNLTMGDYTHISNIC